MERAPAAAPTLLEQQQERLIPDQLKTEEADWEKERQLGAEITKSEKLEPVFAEYKQLKDRFEMALQLTDDPVKRDRLNDEFRRDAGRLGVGVMKDKGAAEVLLDPTFEVPGISREDMQTLFPYSKLAQSFGAVQRGVAETVTGLTAPIMVLAPLTSKTVQGGISAGFGAHMASQVPELARRAGEASVTGDLPEKIESYVRLGATSAFAAGALMHGQSALAPTEGQAARAHAATARADEDARIEARHDADLQKPIGERGNIDQEAIANLRVQDQAGQVAKRPVAPDDNLVRLPGEEPGVVSEPPSATEVIAGRAEQADSPLTAGVVAGLPEIKPPEEIVPRGTEAPKVDALEPSTESKAAETKVEEPLTTEEQEIADAVKSGDLPLEALGPRLRARLRASLEQSSKVEDALDSLIYDTEGVVFDAVQGLPVAIWNGSIRAVKLAIKAGRVTVDAIDEGLKWIRENHPDAKFNEAEYRSRLMGAMPEKDPAPQFGVQTERKGTTALKFAADNPEFQQQFPEESKKIKEGIYVAQTEKGRAEMAKTYLEAYRREDGTLDVEQAWKDLQHPDLMSGADQATHMVTLGRLASEAMKMAGDAKNPIDQARYQKVAMDAVEVVQGRASGSGQALQATPQAVEQAFGVGAVSDAQKVIGKKQQKVVSEHLPVWIVEKLIEKAKTSKQAALDALGITTVLKNVVDTSGHKPIIKRLIKAKTLQELDQAFGDLFAQYSQTDLHKALRKLEPQGGIWSKARERVATAISNALKPPVAGEAKAPLPRVLQDYFDNLSKEARRIAGEQNPAAKDALEKMSPEEQLREIYNNREKYREAMDRAQELITAKYADNPGALAWLDEKIGIMHDTPFSEHTIGTIFSRRVKAEGVNLRRLEREKGDTAGLRQKIVKEVSEAISPELKPKVEAAFDRWLKLKLEEAGRQNEKARIKSEALKKERAEQRAQEQSDQDVEDFSDYENYISDRIVDGVMAQFDEPTDPGATAHLRKILGEVQADVRAQLPKDEATTPKSPEQSMREKLARDGMAKRAFEMLQAKVEQLVKEKPELAKAFKNVLDAKWDETKATSEIGASTRTAVEDLGLAFRDIMRRSIKDQGSIKDALLKRILDHPALKDLPAEDAAKIAEALDREWTKQQEIALRKEFQRHEDLPTVSKRGRSALQERVPELIQLANTGALDSQAFYNVIADKFGLPKFTPELAKKIFDMAQKAQDAPEGLARRKAETVLFDFIKSKSGISKAEVIKGWWYSSVLSGLSTQVRNVMGIVNNLSLRLPAMAARSPKATPKIIAGALRGLIENVTGGELKAILQGDLSGQIGRNISGGENAQGKIGGREAHTSNIFELLKDYEHPNKLKQGIVRLLSNARFVSRFMVAMDSIGKDVSLEAKAAFDAYRASKDGNVTKADVDKAIAEMLQLRPEDRARAKAQADEEIRQGRVEEADRSRRENEILHQARPKDIMERGNKFSLESTYNQQPDTNTLLGSIYEGLVKIRDKHPIVTPTTPFLRIAANVGNQLLNQSPVGLYRLMSRRPNELRRGLPDEKNYSLDDYQQLRAEVLLSHTLALGIMGLAWQQMSSSDPKFQVSGNGLNIDKAKRDQLRAEGWRPYAIKVGNRWFSYRETPYAAMFGTIGYWGDGMRYGDYDKAKKWQDHAAQFADSALRGGALTILDQSALSNLADMFGRGFAAEHPGESGLRYVAHSLGGFVPSVVKDLDSIISPDVQQAKKWFEYFQREIPVGRWMIHRPQLNVLGEPIKNPRYPWTVVTSAETDTPIWQALAEKANKGVFLPAPAASAKNTGTHEKMTDEEFYDYAKYVGEGYKKALTENLEAFKKASPKKADLWLHGEFFDDIREAARDRVSRESAAKAKKAKTAK
jgi:hypothetical protein